MIFYSSSIHLTQFVLAHHYNIYGIFYRYEKINEDEIQNQNTSSNFPMYKFEHKQFIDNLKNNILDMLALSAIAFGWEKI